MKERLQYLMQQFFEGRATIAEQQELMEIVTVSDSAILEPVLHDRWEAMKSQDVNVPDSRHILAAILDQPTPVRHIGKRWYWTAAAILLLFVITGGYIMVTNSRMNTAQMAQKSNISHQYAMLILDDGSTVSLDSIGNRVIQQGGAEIKQQSGQLIYGKARTSSKVAYNTLKTPPGGQFKITLPDGTLVWLNAASSIRYPTVFDGEERIVEMTGEAYFEVAKNAEMPFRVSLAEKTEVRVLGTSFNVNAYQDGGIIKTTLLQGAISMSAAAGKPLILKPGQQAQFNTAEPSGIKVVNNGNISQVIAWQKGIFDFDHANIQSVMNEISRWYNVDIKYEGDLPSRTFRGKINRNLALSEVLNILQDVDIKFRIEGKTIVVYN